MRTFEEARLEEAKFGLRIRDSKASDTSARGHSDPMEVDAVNSLSLIQQGKKGSSSPRGGCFKCGGAQFQRDCNARKSKGKQSSGKSKQSMPWSKSEGKGKSKENKENPNENPKEPKVPKVHTRAKHRKWVCQVLKTRTKSEASSDTQESAQTCDVPLTAPGTTVGMVTNGTMAGVFMSEMMTGVLLDGTKVGNKRMTLPQAHFRSGVLDVCATSGPKRFELVKMNLDTRAAVNTFPLKFGPEGAGDGRFYRTASGEWIPDGGAWQFHGYGENGLLRSLNGRLTGAHKVFVQCCRNRVQRTTRFLPRT